MQFAFRYALTNTKPTDEVLLEMWQKGKDRVAEKAGFARKILGIT